MSKPSVTAKVAVFCDHDSGACAARWESGGDAGSLVIGAEAAPEPAGHPLPVGRSPLADLAIAPVGGALALEGSSAVEARGAICSFDAGHSPESFRLVVLIREDGSVIACASDGNPEKASAWLLDAQGNTTQFSEALISTEFGSNGGQRRVGLELWPEGEDDDPIAVRAAATAIEGAHAPPAGVTPTTGAGAGAGGSAEPVPISAVLLSGSSQGRRALGAYLIGGQK